MGRLCERCAQLIQDFTNLVRKFASRVAELFKECVTVLSECCCFNSKRSKLGHLYDPVLLSYEKQAAQELLNHMETGFYDVPVGNETLEALRIMASSETFELQNSAAIYYLHMSQHMNSQLPAGFLEPYLPLLQSSELEIQQLSSLSLVHFLLEGNLNKELVVQAGLLEPILDLLESGDAAVQCNSCACIMTLAISESNREAIGNAGGIFPLLTLAKSYDPRVQQNAVGAILNLSRSERIKGILCREGALPVLTMLLQSADSEIQYYSCGSLGNIAASPEHHKAMLAIGDKFLLRMLVSLMSSSVQKVSSQACLCLNNLASSGEVRDHLFSMDVMPLILSLLHSSSKDVLQASITLLSTMSHSPEQMNAFLNEEMLQHLALLMQAEKGNTVFIVQVACTIQNLCHAENIEVIVQSPCFEELLLSLMNCDNEEESLQYLVSCIAELAQYEYTQEHLIKKKDKVFIKCLVRHSAFLEHQEVAFQAATVIKHLSHAGEFAAELKPFMKDVQAYLMSFLTHPEMRFHKIAIATLHFLCKDLDFLKAVPQSQMKELLEQKHQQTEETDELLRLIINQADKLNLKE